MVLSFKLNIVPVDLLTTFDPIRIHSMCLSNQTGNIIMLNLFKYDHMFNTPRKLYEGDIQSHYIRTIETGSWIDYMSIKLYTKLTLH